MDLIAVLRHRPVAIWLALAASLAAVALSEGAYWRSQESIAELSALGSVRTARAAREFVPQEAGPSDVALRASRTGDADQAPAAQATASRDDLDRTMMLGRIGVGAFCAVSLLALFIALRQTLAQRGRQQVRQDDVQAQNDRLQGDAVLRAAQLTELTHHLQTAREDERGRLARDLHDELGALLTSAKLDVARMKARLGGTAPEVLERLAHLGATLDSVIALKRRITEDLRPSTLDHLGLVVTLQILAREFGKRSGIAVHCDLQTVPLAPAAELVAYRLVQEAVTNITKYAQASQVWLTLNLHGQQVILDVRDDGVGFDPAVQSGSAHGLLGMRYRVEAEGGALTVTSAPGRGTSIRMSLPMAAA